MNDQHTPQTVVIGAGPAGLTAAWWLARRGVLPLVLESDSQVGGLARTVEYKGYRFDIGGHRFFTKVGAGRAPVEVDDRPRVPAPATVIAHLLPPAVLRLPAQADERAARPRHLQLVAGASQLSVDPGQPDSPRAQLRRLGVEPLRTRLYEIFFKTYTEKVWGIPCDKIRAQWAAQRIKGLSLLTAVRDMLLRGMRKWRRDADQDADRGVRVSAARPRHDVGAFHADISAAGGHVELQRRVTRIEHDGARVTASCADAAGGAHRVTPSITSSPRCRSATLIESLSPRRTRGGARRPIGLHYRDFLTVALIIDQPTLFPDNWIYVHDPGASSSAASRTSRTGAPRWCRTRDDRLGLEYFCFEGDDLWTMSDEELLELGAARARRRSACVDAGNVVDGTVVRMPKAYPVYDEGYGDSARGRPRLPRRLLEPAARRPQRHAQVQQPGPLDGDRHAGRPELLGEHHDLWAVNADDDYHEESHVDLHDVYADLPELDATQPRVPQALPERADPPGLRIEIHRHDPDGDAEVAAVGAGGIVEERDNAGLRQHGQRVDVVGRKSAGLYGTPRPAST